MSSMPSAKYQFLLMWPERLRFGEGTVRAHDVSIRLPCKILCISVNAPMNWLNLTTLMNDDDLP